MIGKSIGELQVQVRAVDDIGADPEKNEALWITLDNRYWWKQGGQESKK